ncbi:hypothetical protein ES705_06234 [subsurface metagenome]
MNSDGSDKVQLATYNESYFHPSWSPDGNKIAYSSEGNIYVITLGEETTPTTTATPATNAASSPTEKIPGFEAIIAISALLIVAYIVKLEIER